MSFRDSFEDRLAIRELLETYACAVTMGDASLLGSVWMEDGIWSLSPERGLQAQGRDAILAKWNSAMAPITRMVFTTMLGSLQIDGNTAHCVSFTTETFDNEGVRHHNLGCYHDVVVKHETRWLFASRTFRSIRRD